MKDKITFRVLGSGKRNTEKAKFRGEINNQIIDPVKLNSEYIFLFTIQKYTVKGIAAQLSPLRKSPQKKMKLLDSLSQSFEDQMIN